MNSPQTICYEACLSFGNDIDTAWLIMHLIKPRTGLAEIKRWEDVNPRSKGALWIGQIFDQVGERLWEEVRLLG